MRITKFRRRATSVPIRTVTALLLVLSYSGSLAIDMNPYSLRIPWFIEGNGPSYWEVRVTCSDKRTLRFIVQREQSGPWCSKDFPENCYEEKLDAAYEVCSGDFSDSLLRKLQSDVENQNKAAQKEERKRELLARQNALIEQRATINKQRQQLLNKEQELLTLKREILRKQSELK